MAEQNARIEDGSDDALCDAYALEVGERLPPILPNLIGEAFVLDTFEQAQAIARACTRAEMATFAVVIRTAQDFAKAQTHPTLRWLERCTDVSALMRLADAFPSATLVLREHAAAVPAAIAQCLGDLPDEPDDLNQRAGVLNNLSSGLSDLGRREEALSAIEQAVGIRRGLALARPDAFRPDLARSLAVLAGCHEAMDRLDAALERDCESVALLTVAFTRWPQAYAGLMQAICQDYLRRCEKAGREPDEALLAPVIAVFRRLQGGEADLQAQPADTDVQGAARVQLKKALAEDAGLMAELAALLQSLPATLKQTQVINGDDNTVVQTVGSTVHIGGR